jgi:hypothetical protein
MAVPARVPLSAVLSGVYALSNFAYIEEEGTAIYMSHLVHYVCLGRGGACTRTTHSCSAWCTRSLTLRTLRRRGLPSMRHIVHYYVCLGHGGACTRTTLSCSVWCTHSLTLRTSRRRGLPSMRHTTSTLYSTGVNPHSKYLETVLPNASPGNFCDEIKL